MNKAEIRPLLVEALERAQDAETVAHKMVTEVVFPEPLAWRGSDRALEEWRLARLARAQAELQLWLADRQWEREEKEALASAQHIASPTSKT